MTPENWQPGDVLVSKYGAVVKYVGEGATPKHFQGEVIQEDFVKPGSLRTWWRREDFTKRPPGWDDYDVQQTVAELLRELDALRRENAWLRSQLPT